MWIIAQGHQSIFPPGFAGDGLRPRSAGLRRSRPPAHAGPRTRAAFEAATQLVVIAPLVANQDIPAKPGCPSRRDPPTGPGFRPTAKEADRYWCELNARYPAGRSPLVKGFRMPARRRRKGVHGGRRPKSLEGGNRGGSSHRRWCRSMGNSPPLLDLICGFRTGRRLSDQLGAGFGRSGWDWCVDLVFGAAGFVGGRWRRGSLWAKRGRCR
jgi:hypothetical protein